MIFFIQIQQHYSIDHRTKYTFCVNCRITGFYVKDKIEGKIISRSRSRSCCHVVM